MKKQIWLVVLAIFVTLTLMLSSCAPKVSQVTTVAGGTRGYTEGKGAAAQFDEPAAIAVGPDGSLYVGDLNKGVVRKIVPDGTVSTLIPSSGNDAAGLDDMPTGLAMDGTNGLVIGASTDGEGTIKLATMDGKLKVLAGSAWLGGREDGKGPAASFMGPLFVAVDKEGNIIVADSNNHRLRKIARDGMVSTFAGPVGSDMFIGYKNGPVAQAQFNIPRGVAVDSKGMIYIADTGNHCIRKITPDGQVTTLAGSPKSGFADGKGKAAQFNYPYGVAVDAAGNVYVADSGNHRIRKITPDGTVTTLAGSGQPGNADGAVGEAQFRMPEALAVDSQGVIYVADSGNNAIRKITP